MRKQPVGFEVSMSARDDGTIEAMYVLISDKSVAETRELDEDILLGDYDDKGELVGIEILAPVSLDGFSRWSTLAAPISFPGASQRSTGTRCLVNPRTSTSGRLVPTFETGHHAARKREVGITRHLHLSG